MPCPSSPTPHTGFAVRGLATSLPGQPPSLPLGVLHLSSIEGARQRIECLGENRRSVCARLGEHF